MKVYYNLDTRKTITELRDLTQQCRYKGVLWRLIEELDKPDSFITQQMKKEGREAVTIFNNAGKVFRSIEKGMRISDYEKFMKNFYNLCKLP